MAKPMQSTKEYDGNTLVLHYYFDEKVKETELKLYNDMVYKTKPTKKDNLK
jgi:hypothetical protein